MQRNRKAVIPAAGLVQCFLPATKAQTKKCFLLSIHLLSIHCKALDSGIEEILIITGRNKRCY